MPADIGANCPGQKHWHWAILIQPASRQIKKYLFKVIIYFAATWALLTG
jgi:hypothetical protein